MSNFSPPALAPPLHQQTYIRSEFYIQTFHSDVFAQQRVGVINNCIYKQYLLVDPESNNNNNKTTTEQAALDQNSCHKARVERARHKNRVQEITIKCVFHASVALPPDERVCSSLAAKDTLCFLHICVCVLDESHTLVSMR